MKNTIQNFFREYDLFSAPAGLRINSNQSLKSCCLGLLSILIFVGMIYLLLADKFSTFIDSIYYLNSQMIPGE